MAHSKFPTEVRLDRDERKLHVAWSDSHASLYPFDLLRKCCPCALCREEKEKLQREIEVGGLPIFQSHTVKPGESRILYIEQVGNYALNFIWQDGHATGIYPFDFLRNLCPCCTTLKDM